MTIAPLPRSLRDYIAPFDVVAICRYRDGRLGCCRDPEGAEAVWWCEADKAGAIMKVAKKNGGDIVAAAKALGVQLTDHATLLARASAAVAKLNDHLTAAGRVGDLGFFNSEYRRRRVEATARGERYMSYPQAQARLKNALAGVAAGDSHADLVRRTFDVG